MPRKLSYWILERHNPQFDKPYYVPYGQLTKKEARSKENPLYGYVAMLEYKTEEEYTAALADFKKNGFSVH